MARPGLLASKSAICRVHDQQEAPLAAPSSLQRPPAGRQQEARQSTPWARRLHLSRLRLTLAMPSARCVAHDTPGVQPGQLQLGCFWQPLMHALRATQTLLGMQGTFKH